MELYSYQFCLSTLDDLQEARTLCGISATSELADERLLFRTAALSVNRERSPLAVVMMESQQAQGGKGMIAKQIAVQMSLAAALERAHLAHDEFLRGQVDGVPCASHIVKEAFRAANHQVYEYAHRMSAGGQLAATGCIGCYDGERCTVARVGEFGNFLWRSGQLIELCEKSSSAVARGSAPAYGTGRHAGGVLQRFIGANSQILVDLASVKVREGDLLIISSFPWEHDLMEDASHVLREITSIVKAGQEIVRLAARAWVSRKDQKRWVLERNIFMALVRVERPVITLTHALAGPPE